MRRDGAGRAGDRPRGARRCPAPSRSSPCGDPTPRPADASALPVKRPSQSGRGARASAGRAVVASARASRRAGPKGDADRRRPRAPSEGERRRARGGERCRDAVGAEGAGLCEGAVANPASPSVPGIAAPARAGSRLGTRGALGRRSAIVAKKRRAAARRGKAMFPRLASPEPLLARRGIRLVDAHPSVVGSWPHDHGASSSSGARSLRGRGGIGSPRTRRRGRARAPRIDGRDARAATRARSANRSRSSDDPVAARPSMALER